MEDAPDAVGRQHRRRPDVMRRDVVIRIGDRDEIRHLAGMRPRIVYRRRPSAGGREVERGDDLVVPHEHLSRRRADREIRLRPLGANAAVHLRPRIGEQIEVLSRVQGRERVRPGGHRLGRIGRLVPSLRHLRWDDPAQVAVERQNVDRHHPTGRSRLQHDIAAVACPAHLERLRARLEPQRRREMLVAEHEAAIEDDRTCRQMQLPALLVDDQERRRRPDAHVCLMRDQQNADRARRCRRRCASAGSSGRGSCGSRTRDARSPQRPTGSSRPRGPSPARRAGTLCRPTPPRGTRGQ